jgi:hypothetical protein
MYPNARVRRTALWRFTDSEYQGEKRAGNLRRKREQVTRSRPARERRTAR